MSSLVVGGTAVEKPTSATEGAWLLEPTRMAGDVNHVDWSVPSDTLSSISHTSPERVATDGKVVALSSEETTAPSSRQRTSVWETSSPSSSLVW